MSGRWTHSGRGPSRVSTSPRAEDDAEGHCRDVVEASPVDPGGGG
jgi:hypothetical protein